MILEAAPTPGASSRDDIARRDRSRQEVDADPPPRRAGLREYAAKRLTAGGSIHHIGYGSFRSPALRRCSEREALHAP